MSDRIEVSINATTFTLNAGETAEAIVTLRNLGQSVDQFTLSIEKLDSEWYTLPASSVALFPNDQDNLKIVLHPPKTADAEAGSHPFRVKVTSQENREEETAVDLTIEIQALPSLELAISPPSITGRKGTYDIEASNPDDTKAVLRLSASDTENKLRYRFQPDTLVVPGKGQAKATLQVSLEWLSLLGIEKAFDFQVRAVPIVAEQGITINGQLVRPSFNWYLTKVRTSKYVTRVKSYRRFPGIKVPWLRRQPTIRVFEATTTDRREFKVIWSVGRAKKVLLADEEVESKGERIVSPSEEIKYILTADNKYGVSSRVLDIRPLPMPEAKVSTRIKANLSPTTFEVAAGGTPVQATMELQNLGDIVDKFIVGIDGIDASWYSCSASSIALMPQASGQVIISLNPPKKKGIKTRVYPFAVTISSESNPGEVASVLGQLEVLPSVEYKLAIRPYRITARRKGTYRVVLTNTSVSNADVLLEATDLDEGLKFRFKTENPIVPAWQTFEIPMVARPKKGSTVGEKKRYDITVTSTDNTSGNSQTVNCELNHAPIITSWRSIFRAVRIILFLGIIGALIGFVIHWGGGFSMLRSNPQMWWDTLVHQATSTFGSWWGK